MTPNCFYTYLKILCFLFLLRSVCFLFILWPIKTLNLSWFVLLPWSGLLFPSLWFLFLRMLLNLDLTLSLLDETYDINSFSKEELLLLFNLDSWDNIDLISSSTDRCITDSRIRYLYSLIATTTIWTLPCRHYKIFSTVLWLVISSPCDLINYIHSLAQKFIYRFRILHVQTLKTCFKNL